MAIQGNRLYWQAWAGGAVAFSKRGWDNGALGGVLQTNSFQEAIHVSNNHDSTFYRFSIDFRGVEASCHNPLHDHIHLSAWIPAWRLDCGQVRHDLWQTDVDTTRQFFRDDRDLDMCHKLWLWSIDSGKDCTGKLKAIWNLARSFKGIRD